MRHMPPNIRLNERISKENTFTLIEKCNYIQYKTFVFNMMQLLQAKAVG